MHRVSLSNGISTVSDTFSSGYQLTVEAIPSAIFHDSSVFLRLVETISVAVAEEITGKVRCVSMRFLCFQNQRPAQDP